MRPPYAKPRAATRRPTHRKVQPSHPQTTRRNAEVLRAFHFPTKET